MFCMKIAGLLIEVHHRFPYLEKQCESWKCPDAEGPADIVVEEISEKELRKEQKQSEEKVSLAQCESICVYREIARRLTGFSAFVMHGAVVELDGEAYVFAAKSGVGKTTHTKMWLEYFGARARYINGDKPIMRWMEGKLWACGTPWMGKEQYGCRGQAPVRAVCFLEQAGENRIRRAEDQDIVERLFHQVLLPEEPDSLTNFMNMMDAMVRKLPFYILECTISQEAVKLAYRTMKQKQDWQYLLEIIRYSISGEMCPDAAWTPDWAALYRICRRHHVEEMVYNGVSRMPAESRPPAEIMEKLAAAWQLGTARDAAQQFALKELADAFEEAHISFVPLKGIWMKRFYPSPELRMLADLDILYRPEQEKEVNQILVSRGYVFDHRDDKHSVYFRKPFMNVEMHHKLASYRKDIEAYYQDAWEKTVPEQEGRCYRRFSWEDYYIYMMVHLAKHVRNSGSGIRSVVDLWLFEKKMGSSLNWQYIQGELSSIRLESFEKHMRKLAKIWFERERPEEFYDRLTEYFIQSGVYGTKENNKIRQVIAKNKNHRTIAYGKFRVRLQIIFLPYKYMRAQYAYLNLCPWLLPAAWMQRAFRTCFKRKGRASRVLSSVNVQEEQALVNQEIFRKLDI